MALALSLKLRSATRFHPKCFSYGKRLSSIRVIHGYSASAHEEWIIKCPYNDVQIPNTSFSQYIYEAQEEHAHKTAFIDGVTGESLTHHQFRELCTRLGSALRRLDVSKGDVVAIISHNCPEFPITFMAVASIGAVNTTVNSHYTPAEIAYHLANSGASTVMTHASLLPTVKKACKLYGGIRHIIVNGPFEDEVGCLSLQKLMKDDGKAFPNNVKINPKEDLVVLPYSSGTTGLPKGVMITHHNLVANLQQLQSPEFNSCKSDSQEVFMGVLPFYHIYGIGPLMGMTLATGSKTVTLPLFEPKLYVRILEKYKISFLHTVPPIVGFLTHSNLVTPAHLEGIHTFVCGAAPVGPALIKDFYSKFTHGIQFQEGYGLTEASPVTHASPIGKCVLGSTGTALPNTKTKIIDLETGKSLGPNEGDGELCIHGPQVMKGYYNNITATKDTIDEEGWLHTGDIAKMDENENVYIVDRLKELIKVKGFQVAPAELEDLLRKHPAVDDVAVIGVPDEAAGEVPRAYIVTSPGAEVSAKALIDYAANEVAPHKKLLGGIFFTDAIPKSATGKILRRELKASALASH